MFSRSVSWLICFAVGTVTATDYSYPNIITASNLGAFVNRLRTDNPEWSMLQSVQKVKDIAGGDLDVVLDVGDTTTEAGNTRIVAHRTIVSAKRPEMAATPRRYTLETSSDPVAVPEVGDPVLRQLLAHLYTLKAQQLLAAANKYSVPDLKADLDSQVDTQMSVEAAAAAAVQPARHFSDNLRQPAVSLMKDHLGQEHTQPQEVVHQSRLFFGGLAATREPTTAQTRTSPAIAQMHSGHSQTSASAASPRITCPTTPLDDFYLSSLRSLSDEEKGSRLVEAAKRGEVEDLRTLLAAGADLEARTWHGKTSLHWAAWNGHAVSAACLLDAGADLEGSDEDGYHPLHMAAVGGHPPLVQLLASWGADVSPRDKWGWTPLHLTVRERHPEAAVALLEVGADREAKTNNGLTPLDMAKRSQYQQMIDVLTKN